MFKVEMLAAQRGDALWIEYGDLPNVHRILIDGGTPSTFDVISRRIAGLPPTDRRFELLIVTHVDLDHIGGVLRLLDDRSLGVSFGDIWFNDWDSLPPDPHLYRGPFDGAIFTELLRAYGIIPNVSLPNRVAVINDQGSLPQVVLDGGMLLTLLSPGVDQLSGLRKVWGRTLSDEGLDAARPSAAKLAEKVRRKGLIVYRGHDTKSRNLDVRALAARPYKADQAEANGSSIAVLAEFRERSCLFAADAFAEVLTTSLARLRIEREGLPIPVHAVKLPHHGSQRNVSPALLEELDCRTYLFSTDGSRFGHPDREAVARVIRLGGPGARLVFNYRSKQASIWDDPDLQRQYCYSTVYPEPGRDGISLVLQ